MKMYKASDNFKPKIEEIEVLRSNKISVWIYNDFFRDERLARYTNWHSFFETKEEARQFLIEKCNSEIQSAKNKIEREEKKLIEIAAL